MAPGTTSTTKRPRPPSPSEPYLDPQRRQLQQQQQQQKEQFQHQSQNPSLYPASSSASSSISQAKSKQSPPTSYSSNNNSNSNTSSTFRNISACNRCRLRKNRCDTSLPACTACQKAGAKCVGYDPITRREIPRSYVYFLETRVQYLESEVQRCGGKVEGPDESTVFKEEKDEDESGINGGGGGGGIDTTEGGAGNNSISSRGPSAWKKKAPEQDESDKLNKLVSNIGMVSVQGASDPRFLGSTSGISFARVVFAAVKSSLNDRSGPGGGRHSSVSSSVAGGAAAATMRDNFFGLHTKPHFKPAPWPDRALAERLVGLYFEHPNPQIPILHKGEFMRMFDKAYEGEGKGRGARECYLLNIVFAIGAGTILLDSKSEGRATAVEKVKKENEESPRVKRTKIGAGGVAGEKQPEEYHASAMMHLESFLSGGAAPGAAGTEGLEVGFGGSLEQLQAVLLLAGFALLRPVAPGLWYIVGVAMRLAVDLGLHYEDGAAEDGSVEGAIHEVNSGARNLGVPDQTMTAEEKGRQEWVRDLRRRLWWCVYSFDRLVSTCVGRPFGVTDQVITTKWPSLLDDKDITPTGFLTASESFNGPSYKRVSHHYFRLRLLQSEILQVLQYRQAQRAHERDLGTTNPFMHTTLSSSFLQPFRNSFPAWRADIDHRLWEWKESAPLQKDTNVGFNVKFLELNYWQAVIMLYRQSLSVPPSLASEKGPHHDLESPLSAHTEDHEDVDEIFLKVAEAGQRVLRLYKELHQVHLVNYTYLATVHLFMAGIAFLYSIWHSPTVRARITLEHVEYTVRAATSVLADLVSKCPPAEACREAFDRMAKATIKMCQTSTGFGSQVRFTPEPQPAPNFVPQDIDKEIPKSVYSAGSILSTGGSRPPPQFDYNLKDLFPEANLPMTRFSQNEESSTSKKNNSATSGWVQQQNNPNPSYVYPSPATTNTSLTSSNPTSNSTSDASTTHPTFRPLSYTNPSNPIPTQLQDQQQQQPQYDPRLLSSEPLQPYDPSTNPQPTIPAINFNPSFDLTTTSNPDTDTFDPNLDIDLSFLLNHSNTTLPQNYYHGDAASGLHLGFDGRVDWTGQGEMPNLFGDFFFNGGTGGMEGDMEVGMEGVEGFEGEMGEMGYEEGV